MAWIEITEGMDLTEILGVKKWETPDFNVNNPLRGNKARGSFPRFLRRTDQERVQNFAGQLARIAPETFFEITLKMDGSSMTVYRKGDEIGVCSRNINLMERDREPWLERWRSIGERLRLSRARLDRWEEKLDAWKCRLFGGRPGLVKQQSVFWHVARNQGLIDILHRHGRNIAFQGELMGPAIQGNREGLKEPQFFLFDIWDIDLQRYWTPNERESFAAEWSIIHAPILGRVPAYALSIPRCLAMASRKSLNHPVAEGVVFKSEDGQTSFKAINTEFLLKEAA